MRPQSLAFPWLLIAIGAVLAVLALIAGKGLAFAIGCLVAVAGLHELRTARTFNEDRKRFGR